MTAPVIPVDSVADHTVEWLLLTYRLPVKPPSLRATVRRKLSAAGAVYLSPACAAAPLSGPAERAMRQARVAITAAGGSAVLVTGRALIGGPELTQAFNAARDLDYEDVISGCRDAVAELEGLAAASALRHQLLWDKDTGLRQLAARYQAVRGLDLLGAGQAEAAAAALARYRSALDEYATRIKDADGS
jgi:hypothetical protein